MEGVIFSCLTNMRLICVLLVADSDGGGSGKEVAALTEKKMARSLPPVNTITYTVRERGDRGPPVRVVPC